MDIKLSRGKLRGSPGRRRKLVSGVHYTRRTQRPWQVGMACWYNTIFAGFKHLNVIVYLGTTLHHLRITRRGEQITSYWLVFTIERF